MQQQKYRFDASEAKKALEYVDTFSIVLLAIALAYLPEGEDDLASVDVDQLVEELEARFDAKIPDENVNKLNAAITLLTTDYIYTDVNVLKAVALTLDDGDMGQVATGGYEPVDVCQILWAVMEDSLINGESFDDNLEKFGDNVSDWINKVIDQEGYDVDSDDSLDDLPTSVPYYGRVVKGKLLLLIAQVRKLYGQDTDLKKEIEEALQELMYDNDLSDD